MADVPGWGRFDPGALTAWAAAVLSRAGADGFEAREVAAQLVAADLRRVESHGTSRLEIYVRRLAAGLVATPVRVRILGETPVSAHVDGQNGFGQIVALQATDLAIAKSKASGMAAVAVMNSNHCGALAYFTLRMAAAGLIGFATTNATANMPPPGGRRPYLGTNPFSWAVPAGSEAPFVVDMATSQVARGKIQSAAREGLTDIPSGWAVDRDGVPTTDPVAALEGMVLPMGGPKGFGLAFMVEVLAGVLSGAAVGPELPRMYESFSETQQVGHFFLAFRPDLFMPEERFRSRMDRLMREIRAVPPAPGVARVMLPGDPEREAEQENHRRGVPVAPGTIAEFRMLAERYDVALPEMVMEGV